MSIVEKTALVHHSAQQMYDLVADVGAYQDFLPWCRSSRLLSSSETQICGEIEVARAGISQKFSTCNNIEPGKRMTISLIEGPFKSLEGAWDFIELNDQACKVCLRLEFEFSGKLINAAFGKVFSVIANDMVDAFCKRANEVYS